MKGVQDPDAGVEAAKAKEWLNHFGGVAWTDWGLKDAMQRS